MPPFAGAEEPAEGPLPGFFDEPGSLDEEELGEGDEADEDGAGEAVSESEEFDVIIDHKPRPPTMTRSKTPPTMPIMSGVFDLPGCPGPPCPNPC